MTRRQNPETASADLIGGMILAGILAAGIAIAFISLYSAPVAGKVPVLDVDVTNTTTSVFLTHKGGDTLRAGEFRILTGGQDITSGFTKQGAPLTDWSVGDTIEYRPPGGRMPAGYTVVYTGMGTPQVILELDV